MNYTNLVGQRLNCNGLDFYNKEGKLQGIISGYENTMILKCFTARKDGEDYLEFTTNFYVKAVDVIRLNKIKLSYEIY